MDTSIQIFLIATKYGGPILNFIGSVMIALSFGKNAGGAHQPDEAGHKIYLASFLHPRLFKFGLILLMLGFFITFCFQIME